MGGIDIYENWGFVMDGVTILNSWTTYALNNWISGMGTLLFASIAIAFIIICVIGGIIDHDRRGVAIGICGCIISAALALFSFYVVGYPLKEITRYEVTISDDVSFNEFMERYTILKQRGDIYTVEDKNNA